MKRLLLSLALATSLSLSAVAAEAPATDHIPAFQTKIVENGEPIAGKPGQFAMTVSAIGKMGMPGYALYSSSKFAVQGFQQALRTEMPKNIRMTCLYPVATNTNFFKAAVEGQDKVITQKPFPVQNPKHVAKAMVRGIERKRKYVNPCKLFSFAQVLFAICPPVRSIYWALERKKLDNFIAQKNGK